MNLWKLSTFVLAGALATVVTVPYVTAAHAEEQPHMEAAHQLLKMAKEHLQLATTDKGGHRVKAIGLVNDAVEQVQKGINFDNAHGPAPAPKK